MRKTRTKYFLKQEWYSFCSAHNYYNDNCENCSKGTWKFLFILKISQFFYLKTPRLWRFITNI